MIESVSNKQVKQIQKLKKSARFRREQMLFVAEGIKMIEEADRYGLLHTVYVAEHIKEEYSALFLHNIKAERIEMVSDTVFREMSDTQTPQGILALVNMPEYRRQDILAETDAALVCLEDIQDPGNLGTILRTAEGAGMSGLVLSKGCVDLFNPKVVRATMGALYRMPFYFTEDMTTEVELLKKEGFTMYAARLDGSRNFTEFEYQGKTGLLIGNEGNGLKRETSACADIGIRIPMEGEVESLNAAVSAALLMYEVHRHRCRG
jgi:TrmH family RNA methyltransferase